MAPAQPGERIERLHHPGALGSSGLPTPPARLTTATMPLRSALRPVATPRSEPLALNSVRRDILDPAAHRQAVLRDSDQSRPQISLNLFMLHAVKAVGFEQRAETPVGRFAGLPAARGSR